MIWIFYGVLIINVIAFAMFFYDKEAAIWKSWRIQESMLKFIAYFGPIGTIAAIKLFNHKTRKFKSDIKSITIWGFVQAGFLLSYYI